MPTTEALQPRELDVRPMLRAGQEPFQAIMDAVSALLPGQPLRLIAPFRPVPLYSVMANRGFAASDRALEGGDWEVLFSPVEVAENEEGLAIGSSPSAVFWGDPVVELDLCDLPPPEPMVRILEALEGMQAGDVLFALLGREPVFLFPELAKRQHEWAGNFDAAGTTYRLLVRHGGGKGH
ncbi:DUF2249 domain-containing protein [Bosea thiooxidans]